MIALNSFCGEKNVKFKDNTNFITKNKKILLCFSMFRPGLSTENALNKILSSIYTALEKKSPY